MHSSRFILVTNRGRTVRNPALAVAQVQDSSSREMAVAAESESSSPGGNYVILSFRASFSGFIISLVDNTPSEIALISFKNVNALATWNTERTTDSTVFAPYLRFRWTTWYRMLRFLLR